MYFSYINDYSKAMGLDSILNIAHQACAKYSTLNKIAQVNCAKTGDMEIAEIAHHFSLCTGKNGVLFFTCFCVLLLILHI